MDNQNDDVKKWVQVDSIDHYSNVVSYLTPQRMASIGYQLKFINKYFPGDAILEIGPGSHLSTQLLRNMGHEVRTLDVDGRLKPDILASITEIPLADSELDCFLCSQVLEHLPWDTVDSALAELYRVTKHGGVISVPTNQPTFLVMKYDSKSSGTRRIKLGSRRNKPMRTRNGEHNWELEANVTLKEFVFKVENAGFKVIHRLQPFEYMYHQFLIVRRS